MKRACVLLLPAMLLIVLATSACNDESQPIFTRVRVTPVCGVAPLNVETFAAVSGGNESGDPLGGTNNLEIAWNYHDGGSGRTSINYHQYLEAGEYEITVTATDPDGKTATSSVPVTVMTDSLVISATSDPEAGEITAGQTVQFGLTASSCDIDYPAAEGDAVKMSFRWDIGDTNNTVYSGPTPQYTFNATGEYDVQLTVTYPAQAVTRRAVLHFNVTQ